MLDKRRYHIAIVCPALGNAGSVANIALRHASLLAQRYSVSLLSDSLPAELPPGVKCVKFPVVQFNWLRRFCHVPNELSFLFAARSVLNDLCGEDAVDLVMCHSHGLAAFVGGRMKARHRYLVVMTTHGDIFDRPAGTYSPELSWFYRQVTPRAYLRSDFVQALCPYMAQWAIRGGTPASRVRVIPNGFNPEKIQLPVRLPRPADTFIAGEVLRLLFVGNLSIVKGVEFLLRAVSLLVTRSASSGSEFQVAQANDIHLTVVGDGGERPMLERLVGELRLAGKVKFVGRVQRESLGGFYQEADILCIPSLSEALPTVALEGMWTGLPVVGSNTGGIPFAVDEGINGYLAAPGDANGLATAIALAAKSREHLAALGVHSYHRAQQHFAWPVIGEQLVELIDDALARK